MHVLIVTSGSAGDLHPFVAVGKTLAARGHEVELFANEVFAGVVERAGLAYVEHGTAAQYHAAIEDPDLWHPRKGLKVIMSEGVVPALEPTLDAIRERRRDDTVLVGGTLALGARVAQEVLDLPMATLQLAPSVFRTLHRMPRFAGLPGGEWMPKWLKRAIWRLGDRMTDPLILPRLNALRERHGLRPVRRVFDEWLHSPDLVVGLFPEWFGPIQPDWPEQLRLTGFPLFDESDQRPANEDLEAWLAAGDKPVVFTAGSANAGGQEFFAASVEACERMGRRGLLLTMKRDSAPRDLPGSVRWEKYAPFSRVLSRAAAFVNHGGIGSVAQGIAAGIPQLVTPISFDQFDNASRLLDLGVGASLPQRRYTAGRATRALEQLVSDPGVAAHCETLRDRLPADPLTETAALIEGLAK
jgi:UDP:flavonoid glycosyltransferase YjiC (YdhE family)